jgi:hypothetical protein
MASGNDRMHAVNEQRALADLPEVLICECGRPGCSEHVTLNAVEYRGLRTHSTWFLIAASEEHFFPDVERIVAKNGTYWIVEKHDGAARIVERLDLR